MSIPTIRTDALTVDTTVIAQDGSICTVTHVQALADGRIMVVFADGHIDRAQAGRTWPVASAEQIAAAEQASRTDATALLLDRLADMIRAQRLPAPNYSIDVSVFVRGGAELEQWATALGAPIERGGVNDTIPVVRADDVDRAGGVRLDVHVQAPQQSPAAEAGESR